MMENNDKMTVERNTQRRTQMRYIFWFSKVENTAFCLNTKKLQNDVEICVCHVTIIRGTISRF
jgi:hypothetical protein